MAERLNRLASEQSPYLRQHAANPVDWYPWGTEALDRARREDKPILLSIGYSACHWCHVMERESFEDARIASLMNDLFVNIKVDREERPDLDTIYMNAVQLLTGSGGWPLTVFLTPDGKPYYGGTYFPPEDRHGRPGFPRVLEALARAFRESRGEVARTAQQLMDEVARLSRYDPLPEVIHPDTVARAAEKLLARVDPVHGGMGAAPKFPNVPVFSLLLRRHRATDRAELLDAVTLTLDRMAMGGIYDQIGGGFHRYSVDEQWLVPHFEKMLYDNALLVPLYLDAYRVTQAQTYRRVAEETLDYLLREMTHPEGGFFSSQDADSEGEEGKFYVWDFSAFEQLLPADEGALARRYFRVDPQGNFAEAGCRRASNILHRDLSPDGLAAVLGRDPAEITEALRRARLALLAERGKRVAPALDDKILTSWNALAIRAFVHAANVLGEQRFLVAALRAARFLERNLTTGPGELLRSWRSGAGRYAAYLDDYAFLGMARLDLFAATGDLDHLVAARRSADILLRDFADSQEGGFFFTASTHEALVDRPKTAFDGSIPSGNAMAVELLIRLDRLDGSTANRDLIERSLGLFGAQMNGQPFATAALLGVLDELTAGSTEVVVVGARDEPRTRALLAAAHATYRSDKAVFFVDPGAAQADLPESLRAKPAVHGHAAAYVCRNSTCSPPTTDPAELASLLST